MSERVAYTLRIRWNEIFRLQLKHKFLIDDGERGDDDDDADDGGRIGRYRMPTGEFIQLLNRG